MEGRFYLGDGVYAEMEDLDLVLTTSGGMPNRDNRIVLEPEVLDNLNKFLQRWFAERNKT